MEIKNSTLDDIAAVIGFTATLRLCVWFGDVGRVYIPATVDDGQLLVRHIGKPAAIRLSKEWPGEHITVPRLTTYERDMVRRMIAMMITRGCSTREVSHMTRVSERRVQQVCRELELAGLIPVMSRKNRQENEGC